MSPRGCVISGAESDSVPGQKTEGIARADVRVAVAGEVERFNHLCEVGLSFAVWCPPERPNIVNCGFRPIVIA